MKSGKYKVTKSLVSGNSYLTIELKEGHSDSFIFSFKESFPITPSTKLDFEASYVAWQQTDSENRMPWSKSLLDELISQISKFNSYQSYIANIEIDQIMTTKLHTFYPKMNTASAARKLIELKISGAPVVDEDNNLVGILSEKDILSSLLEETVTENSKSTSKNSLEIISLKNNVSTIMTKAVISIGIKDDITNALRLMQSNNLRRMPVIKNDKLVGILSIGDIHRAIFKSCIR
jgi:CBS domain-containing protein